MATAKSRGYYGRTCYGFKHLSYGAGSGRPNNPEFPGPAPESPG